MSQPIIFKPGSSRIKRIGAIMRKEISNLISDRVAILILFIIPLVVISIIGASKPNPNLTSITIWVIDEDNTTISHQAMLTFSNTTTLNEAGLQAHVYITGEMAPVMPEIGQDNATAPVNITNAEEYLPTQYLDAYVVLPPGFTDQLAATGKSEIDIYYDCISITNRFISEIVVMLGETNIQMQDLLLERDVFYYPAFRPVDFANSINILELGSPILVGLMLFFSINLVCTQCIVGDTPLQRLLTTPVYRSEVITGKILGYTVIGIFQIIISLLLIGYFNVPIRGLWIDIFILLLFNSIASTCMGVFISTISKTRLQASQLFLMFFFVLLILTYYVRAPIFLAMNPIEQTRIGFSNIAFRGDSLTDIWQNLLDIGLTALGYYILTVIYIAKFKKEFV